MTGAKKKRSAPLPKKGGNKKSKPQRAEVEAASSLSEGVDTMGVKQLDDEEIVRWASLAKPPRQVLGTKFIDMDTLVALGMEDVMRQLFRKVGLEGFLTKRAQTYQRYTYEFLSSLERRGGSNPGISFSLNDCRYFANYDRIRGAFGWAAPPPGNAFQYLTPGDCCSFWKSITGFETEVKGDHSNIIPHPALRLAHRFLATTVYCKGEASKINREEMSFLWAMTPEGVGIPDWVDIFISRCLKIRDSPAGNLGMGGMITLLAEHMDVALPRQVVPFKSGGMLYNVPTLVKVGLLSKTNRAGIYRWHYGIRGASFLWLPRPAEAALTYGTTAKDFFLPPDVGPNKGDSSMVCSEDSTEGDGDDEEDEADAEEPTSSALADWSSWRAGVDDRLEEIYDMHSRSSAFVESISNFLVARYPKEYTPPSTEFLATLDVRAADRAARRASRLPSGSPEPGESSDG